MYWPLLLLLLILIPDAALACNSCQPQNAFLNSVTFEDPATYRVIYTGIEGLLLDEYVRAVSRKWSDDIELFYNSGAISEFELSNAYNVLNNTRSDYFDNTYTDNRTRWWHYMSDWGPIKTYHTGPSGDLINIGPIRVSNKFRFKLKDYEADLTNNWTYRLRPVFRVTSRAPFVRVVGAGQQFTFADHGKKLFRVTLAVGANLAELEGLVELHFELLTW